MKKAAELLQKGELQISEKVFEIGFNDSKYFRRIFKIFYKSSPYEFERKKLDYSFLVKVHTSLKFIYSPGRIVRYAE